MSLIARARSILIRYREASCLQRGEEKLTRDFSRSRRPDKRVGHVELIRRDQWRETTVCEKFVLSANLFSLHSLSRTPRQQAPLDRINIMISIRVPLLLSIQRSEDRVV